MTGSPPNAIAEKVGGIVLLAAGVLLLKLGVLDPLEQARARAFDVSTSTASSLVAPFALILGACLLLLPPRSVWNFLSRPSLRDPRTQKLTRKGYLLVVAVLTPGLLLYGWLEWQLGRLGYG